MIYCTVLYTIFRFLAVFLCLKISLLTPFVLSADISPIIEEGPTKTPLGCHKRQYTYRVTQADQNGFECWDNVSVMSCWGRCDSNEISDWKFPYKRSFHPVCVHAQRGKAVAMLRHCHPEAGIEAQKYEYMEAVECSCRTCSSTDTSCEAPRQLHSESAVKILALTGQPNDLEEEYN